MRVWQATSLLPPVVVGAPSQNTPANVLLNDNGKPVRVMYVSNDGDDANPGTLNKPFKTLRKTLPRMRAGDILLLRGGTYPESIETDVSTQLSTGVSWYEPIVIAGMPGERPVLAPENTCFGIHLARSGDQFMSFENLVIDGSKLCVDEGDGVQVDKSITNIRLLNLEVKNCPGPGVSISSNTNKIEITGCEIHGNSTNPFCPDFALSNENRNRCFPQIGLGGTSSLIRSNNVYDGPGDGIRLYAAGGLKMSNNIVQGNAVRDISKLIESSRAISIYNGVNTLICNNIVRGNLNGITVNYDENENIKIYHNTIVGTNGLGVRVDDSRPVSFVNNILFWRQNRQSIGRRRDPVSSESCDQLR